MSKLLDDLIKQSRTDAVAYEKFLRQAQDLVRRLAARQPEDGIPSELHGQREAAVIYNNLEAILAASVPEALLAEDPAGYGNARVLLALEIDHAMRLQAPAGWKGDETKERVVQNFLFLLMKKDRAATLALFELIKNQPGYS